VSGPERSNATEVFVDGIKIIDVGNGFYTTLPQNSQTLFCLDDKIDYEELDLGPAEWRTAKLGSDQYIWFENLDDDLINPKVLPEQAELWLIKVAKKYGANALYFRRHFDSLEINRYENGKNITGTFVEAIVALVKEPV